MQGRDAELKALAAELVTARTHDRLVLVGGEPGIGKSRLVSEFSARQHAEGATVLFGRSTDGPDQSFRPLAEAVDHYVRHASSTALDDDARSELARIVPGDGRPLNLRPGRTPASGAEQFVLFGAIASVFQAAAGSCPLVLVLEDLHWADEGTVLMLQHLMARPDDIPLLVVGTYRPSEVATDSRLAGMINELSREGQLARVELGALAPEDALLLLTEFAGHGLKGSDAELAGALHAESGGNPLFLTELVRALLDSGAIRVADGRWRIDEDLRAAELPRTLTEVIQRRVAGLGDVAASALSAAAVVGQEFDPELVERCIDGTGEQVSDVWDRAERAGLVTAIDPGRLGFNHPLVARALYDGLGSRERARLHRQVAEAIEALGRSADPEELARHWCRAAPPEPAKASLWASRAGRRALDRFDGNTARRWYGEALELYSRSGEDDERTRCELLIGLGASLRRVGEPGFREVLLDAARLAERLGDSELLVRAALLNNHGFASVSGAVDEEKVAVLQAALRAVGDADTEDRSRLLATLAVELTFSGEWERRLAVSDEAVAVARRLGSPAPLAQALTMRFVPTWMPQTLEERLANTSEALRLADELGDPWAQFHAARWRFVGLVQSGALAAAGPVLSREVELARRLGDPTTGWLSAYDRATLVLIAGKLEEAEQLATGAVATATGSGPRDPRPIFATLLTAIRYEQGRLPELQPMIAAAVAENPGLPVLRAMLALGYAEGELRDEARNLLAIDLESGFADVPADPTWLAALGIYAHVAADLGDRAAAEALYALLVPWTDQILYAGVGVWGSVDRAVGRLGIVLGRFEEAETRLCRAIERAARIGAPIWLAHGQLDLAGLLLARDAPGDRERAVEALDATITGAARVGAATVERRARCLREHQRVMEVTASAGPSGQRLRLGVASPTALATNGDFGSANGRPANGRPVNGTNGHRQHGADGRRAVGELLREGDYWTVRLGARSARLRDSKGIGYLAVLIGQPGVEVHAVDLQAGAWGPGAIGAADASGAAGPGLDVRVAGSEDAGAVLDPEAKREYRVRIEELEAEIDEAERFNDPERASRSRDELEFIARELAAAVGIGGRDRKAASQAERARVECHPRDSQHARSHRSARRHSGGAPQIRCADRVLLLLRAGRRAGGRVGGQVEGRDLARGGHPSAAWSRISGAEPATGSPGRCLGRQ